MLRAPASLYFFLGAMAFLGFVFVVMSSFQISIFLDLAYLYYPLFFLPLAAVLISKERESGFASILFTHPISIAQYYLSKFLALLLIVGVYILALLPYDVLIVVFAGPGWAVEVLRRIAWTLITASFAIALGLLISAALGRRATLPSVSLGFALALALAWGPFLGIQYLSAFGPSTIDWVLALLHISPLMGGMDAFRSHGLMVGQPLYSLLLSASLAAFLLLAGLTIYRRLQSPEGWEAHASVRVGSLAVVVAVLVVAPLVPPYDYTFPELSGSNCVDHGGLFYCAGIRSGPPASNVVGTEVEGSVVLSIDNGAPEPALVPAVSLSWESEYLAFNITRAQFASVVVPPYLGTDPDASETIILSVPVTIVILRARTLGPSFSNFVPVVMELEADGLSHRQHESLPATPLEYNQDTGWLVLVALAAVAVGGRALGRARRRRQ
ncbi:MAG: ABC transporter permease [Thermoplasmata archaeon]